MMSKTLQASDGSRIGLIAACPGAPLVLLHGVGMCAEAVPLFERELGRRLKSDLASEAAAWGLTHMRSDREARTRQLYDIFFRGELGGVTDG